MRLRWSGYWACQLFGWGFFILVNIFFAFTLDRFELNLIQRLLIFVGLGFSFSHLMRLFLVRSDVFNKSLQRQLVTFMLITIVFAFAVGTLELLLTRVFDIATAPQKTFGGWKILISNVFASFFYLFLWNCIYFSYHYVQISRRQQLDTLKLEALVKELQQNAVRG